MCSHGRNRRIFANFATEISIVQIHLGLISKFKEERKKKGGEGVKQARNRIEPSRHSTTREWQFEWEMLPCPRQIGRVLPAPQECLALRPDAIIASPTCCAYRRGCANLAKSRILTANSIFPARLPASSIILALRKEKGEPSGISISHFGIKQRKKKKTGGRAKKKGADFY